MTHPSSLDLEAFVVGEPLPSTFDGHVEECPSCGAFVAELRGVVATSPSRSEADAAVVRAQARILLVAARPQKTRLWALATTVVAPLAAAAAIIVLARSSFSPPAAPFGEGSQRSPVTSAPPPPDRIQMGTMPEPGLRTGEPDTQFKGGMQIAVVRERDGQQARFTSRVPVRPGDRLRVEVALDREQAILGAVLADDGSYLELMPQAVRGPGTHFSERSAKIDAAPTDGTIVIGSPEGIARARQIGGAQNLRNLLNDAPGIATLRVEWEQP